MKKIALFGLSVLVAIMMLGGMTAPAAAEDESGILLKIAKKAQDQIKNHISDDSSNQIKKLFQEGSNHVDALSTALSKNDSESSKKNFFSAMKIFKQISQLLTQNDTPKAEIASTKAATNNPTSDLLKLHRYYSTLKTIAEKNNMSFDSTEINNLFTKAREQIISKQFGDAQETISAIKLAVNDIKKQLGDQSSQQKSEHAKRYAQQYLEQLDRLIQSVKNQGVPDDVIKKLEDAREKLSSASTSTQIIQQVREIISLKNEHKLNQNNALESKIIIVERTISKLDNSDKVDPEIIENAKENLQKIKLQLSDGEVDNAKELLSSLIDQLKQAIKSSS